MRRFIAVAGFFLLFATSAAFAQGTGTGVSSKSVSPAGSVKAVGSAPVGHRQPTAADVGKDPGADAARSAEDRELDRKIRSICKGC